MDNSREHSDLIVKVKRVLLKRNMLLISILLLAPFVGVIDMLFKSNKVTLAVAISVFIYLGWQVGFLTFTRCPRCHKFFFCSGLLANVFTNKCMNCGLGE